MPEGKDDCACVLGFEIEWPHWWVVIVSCFFLTPPCHTFSDFQCCIGSLFKNSSKNLKATLNTESFETPTKHGPTTWMAQRLSVSWMFWKKQLEGHTPSTRFASRRCFFFHMFFFCRELPFTSKGSSTRVEQARGWRKTSLMILRSFGMWNWKSNTACWGRIPEDCTSHTFNKISQASHFLWVPKIYRFSQTRRTTKLLMDHGSFA